MIVCRSCLRQLRTFNAVTLSRQVQRNYVAAVATLPRSRRDDTEIKSKNSFSLRTKIEHLLRMKNPEEAEDELRRSRFEGSVYSWNLLIKYYAKQGMYADANHIYQQMKKCGVKPILDTYIQLAHGIGTLQHLQRSSTPPKARYILEVIERLEDFDDWTTHKNIGILLACLKNAVVNPSLKPETLERIIRAAHKVWSKTNPLEIPSSRPQAEINYDLNHYLLILSMSTNTGDLKTAKNLLHNLEKHPSQDSRMTALRVAQRLQDQRLAKKYWTYFNDLLPFDPRAARLYLTIFSKTYDAKEAADTLDLLIQYHAPEYPRPVAYLLALLPCAPLPNLNSALRVYEKVKENPEAMKDFELHRFMVTMFLRATTSEYALKRFKPDFVYSILRIVDMPELLKRKDVPVEKRLELIEDIKKIIVWRLKKKDTRKNKEIKEEVLEGDMKFYERWEQIIKNEEKKTDNEKGEIKNAEFRRRGDTSVSEKFHSEKPGVKGLARGTRLGE